ncbi:MAG: HAD family hydrolase [Planctomycetota bacterium]|jgi:phosphoglycolate phosphatase-like HAD superfamily hydrolase
MDNTNPASNRSPIPWPKLLLFDIDGTLLKSRGGSLRAMTRAARQVFSPTFNMEAVDRNGRLDPEIIAAALELNGVDAAPKALEAFRKLYLEELRAEAKSNRPLPGARPLLERLRATEGVILGAVTGNYGEAARIKLQAVGIDPAWFVANGFGEQEPTRSALVRRAIREAASRVGHAIPESDVVIVGDTPRDVECAKDNHCRCVAVATGNFAADLLEQAGADVVLPDLTDPAPLWAMIERLQP